MTMLLLIPLELKRVAFMTLLMMMLVMVMRLMSRRTLARCRSLHRHGIACRTQPAAV